MDGQRDRPTIRAYAFIESVIMPKELDEKRGLVNIVIDAIKTDFFLLGSASEGLDSDLLIVRILSTINRLEERFPASRWDEGSWIEIERKNSPGDPPAWLLLAEDGYSHPIERMNITQTQSLGSNPFAPTPVEQKLTQFCQSLTAKRIDASTTRPPKYIGEGPFVRVVDVGQANFSVIHAGNRITSRVLGYFDVGGPLFFHGKSFPKAFNESTRVADSGFVVLSHWDFDHYSLAVSKIPKLRELDWYAPDQPVGPNVAALQAKLRAKLTLLSDSFPFSPVRCLV